MIAKLFNSFKKSPLLALLNSKRLEISPKNGWRARVLARRSFSEVGAGEPMTSFPNWRYLLDKIRILKIGGVYLKVSLPRSETKFLLLGRTDFINGLRRAEALKTETPFRPPRLEAEAKGTISSFSLAANYIFL